MTSVFTVLIISLQFSSKRLTNPPVTQQPPHLLLDHFPVYSPPPAQNDWIAADGKDKRTRDWTK